MAERLDAALAARGLARSRTNAAHLIGDGLVTVDGRPALKPSLRVRAEQELAVAATDHYVSRAAHKLNAALDAFAVDVAGRTVLDVGASTGGFTQVLLERGALSVIALDVGHEQLAAAVRADERVVVIEGMNARYLTRETLSSATPGVPVPDLVVADLSFIPLGLVLPAIVQSVEKDADVVVLIKPQFEVGRGGVKEGIVRDAGLREDAISGVLWAAWDLGLGTAGLISSPIAGSAGNHEYLAWFSTGRGSNPTEWTGQVSALAKA
ncbi:TlyA family RNA methyltransferase [Terrimesophilobacter mesophilus]|uniref:TlyA family RNA methyltransferase n=1 Tax=Terrimesophilobacter mesophilus TaxID=433647 RepID=A0A4V3I9T8_9MICO|nr:TlyA family RNA methyltransferase [Terrimesophilobacter mesophilus]